MSDKSDFSLVKIDGADLKFLQRLIGPIAEAGDFISDKIRFYRWRSALETIEEARKIADARGLSTHEVPLKFLVPFLEASSLEEDGSDIQKHWAELLAQASHDRRRARLAFVDVLRTCSSEEVSLLDQLVNQDFIKFLLSAPAVGELKPAFIINALITMRRIQLTDHVEKSVGFLIDVFEDDLKADVDSFEDFLTALMQQDHPPVAAENIVISDRTPQADYATANHEAPDAAPDSMKSKWDATLENRPLHGTNIDLMLQRVELDALIAKGLVDRTYHNFDAWGGHALFSLICPTALGIEFVTTCRGTPLPYPPDEPEDQSEAKS